MRKKENLYFILKKHYNEVEQKYKREVSIMDLSEFVVYLDYIIKMISKYLAIILKFLGIDWAEEDSTGGFLSGLFK